MEPIAESINSGDCFILIATNILYLWIGELTNVIEKSKATDIYEWIKSKRDMGIKSSTKCAIIEEKNCLPDAMSVNAETFWSLLGGFKNYQQVTSINEDEEFEMLISDTNMVYRVIDDFNDHRTNENHDDSAENYALYPLTQYWGCVLSYNMLDEDHVYVFDFGSEVYVWNGRNAGVYEKKYGMLLAKQLFDSGYDYTNCILTPVKCQYNYRNNFNESNIYVDEFFKSTSRPSWTLLGRVSQNVETILFKEKFYDWPSESTSPSLKKLAYSKSTDCNLSAKKTNLKHQSSLYNSPIKTISYEPINAKILLDKRIYEENPVNLILENTNIGRGRHWYDVSERRGFDVLTDNIKIWRIENNELVEQDETTFGELYSNETYLIKWKYKLVPVGFRTLKGELSQHQSATGRDRQALFFWHGINSSQNEKGASALLTLGLGDKSVSSMPHVLVYEQKEIAAFCQLFSGSLIIFKSKNLADDFNTKWKMFLLRGAEIEEENHLIEIDTNLGNLRSKTSLILANKDKILVWHGCYSPECTRNAIISCARKLIKNHQLKFQFSDRVVIEEVEEGFESDEFIDIFLQFQQNLRTLRHQYYYSLLSLKSNTMSNSYQICTPRLFNMYCLFGKFEAKETLNPLRSDKTCTYPFYQFNLDEEKQPALFLFDNTEELYIWQGWLDKSDDAITVASEINSTNTVKMRYNESRKCALQTAINYWNVKYADENKPFKGYIVYAGLEPIEFRNLFPIWHTNEIAKSCNLNVSFIIEFSCIYIKMKEFYIHLFTN